jgi:hypothetical protein
VEAIVLQNNNARIEEEEAKTFGRYTIPELDNSSKERTSHAFLKVTEEDIQKFNNRIRIF